MKPQDLFIGIRDFLALLVPGIALLILLPVPVLQWLSQRVQIAGTTKPDTALLILVFLAAALTAGSVLAGFAGLADDFVDDYVKRGNGRQAGKGFGRKLSEHINRLHEAEALAKSLEAKINPLRSNAERQVGRKSKLTVPWSVRSFWWNYLRLNCPVAIAELDRIEGLQKQFRSLSLVALLGAAFSIEARIDWHLLSGTEDVGSRLNRAFGPLGNLGPWLLFAAALFLSLFLFMAYVGYRVRFSRRLYELAIIHAIPKETVSMGAESFFAPEDGTGNARGANSKLS